MRAFARGGFQNAGAQALAAHLHQPEARNTAYLDTRAVVLQRILHAPFHLAHVSGAFHVDEIYHHQARHIAQAQLAGNFLRRFKVGVQRGLLNPMLLCGATRVDVDRHQRFCRVDDQIAAGFQLHHRIVHGR